MSYIINPHRFAAASEVVTKSCRFDGTSAYMSRTFGTPTDLDKWTWACWVKRAEMDTLQVLFGSLNISGSPVGGGIYFSADNTLTFYDAGSGANLKTTAVFRDYSSWYHLAVTSDSAGGDAAIYVNGELITDFSTETEPSGTNSAINTSTAVHHIAREVSVTGYFAGVYLADMYFVDGAIVTPNTNFIETDGTTGQLKPKAYTVSGTNGFHLDFKDSADLGNDAAGSNDFAESGLVASDQMNDRPTNNYCVWNPLTNDNAALSEGNLKAAGTDDTATIGSIGVSTGQWYWEIYTGGSSYQPYLGVTSVENDTDAGYQAAGRSYAGNALYKDYTATSNTADTDLNGSAVWGFALDLDSGTRTLKIYKNNTLEHTDSTIPANTLLWPMSLLTNSGGTLWHNSYLNAGQDPTFAGNDPVATPATSEFAYTPPSGYSALSTANLPTPTIAKGNEHFDTLLYTSSGEQDGLSFQPDLVWIKSRQSANEHELTDSVRTATKALSSDSSNAESTDSTGLTSFDSDGFTVGADSNYSDTGAGMVAWNWKAGTGFDPAGGSATTDGSKNATAGFSIAKWTGNSTDYDSTSHRTLAHGLSAAPNFAILKSRASQNWVVYHKSLTTGDYVILNEAYSSSTHGGNLIVDAGWDATNFKVGNDGFSSSLNLNLNSTDYIGYFLSEVAGHSRFTEFTGASGAFCWLGFRPALLILKSASSGGWYMFDSKREGYNADNDRLYADATTTEDTTDHVDLLSNGFKIKSSSYDLTSGTVLVMAWAESPFKYSSAR